MRPTLLAVLALATPTLLAQKEGAEAPEIVWERTFEFGDIKNQKLSDLRGSVVMLMFWTSFSTTCAAEVPRLNGLFVKKSEDGLVIVGVTGDDPNIVASYVKKHGVKYPLATAQQKEYRIRGVPEAMLIDKEGKLVWRGHPGSVDEAQIDRLLVGAKPAVTVAGLADVQALRRAGNFGEAWAKAKELLDGGQLSPRAQAQATEWSQAIEQFVAAASAAADTAEAANDPYTAWANLEPLATKYAGAPGTDGAKARLEKLLADPKQKREIDVGKKLAEAKAKEAVFEFDAAYDIYKAAASAFGNTKGGKLANAAFRALEKDGKLGYVHTCGFCKAGGAACPQHRRKKK